MNINLMRAIDHLLGVPLVWLLSPLLWLRERWAGPAGPVRRVLFVELSEMGSAILADPAIRKAQATLGAEPFFCIFARNADCLALTGRVPADNIFTIRDDRLHHLLIDTLRFRRWCRRRDIDTLVDLELFSRYSALLSGISGAARRVGFCAYHSEGLSRGRLHSHRVWYNPHLHIAKNFLSLVNALLAPAGERPYSKRRVEAAEVVLEKRVADPQQQARARRTLVARGAPENLDGYRLILLNLPSPGLIPQRCWPRGHYVGLATRLLERDPRALVLLSGAGDVEAEAATVATQVDHPRCLAIAGAFSIRELPGLFALAELMVCSDSGPAHLASVSEMPVVVLFGPETPALYGPIGRSVAMTAGLACSPCVTAANHRRSPCGDNLCMQQITPEQVAVRVEALISGAEVISIGRQARDHAGFKAPGGAGQ